MNVPVNRLPQRIEPDPHRTIARFFNPGGDPVPAQSLSEWAGCPNPKPRRY